ncbi:hypothetical protein KUCAC02_022009, partial [Chaenocephalus aceratus]
LHVRMGVMSPKTPRLIAAITPRQSHEEEGEGENQIVQMHGVPSAALEPPRAARRVELNAGGTAWRLPQDQTRRRAAA